MIVYLEKKSPLLAESRTVQINFKRYNLDNMEDESKRNYTNDVLNQL